MFFYWRMLMPVKGVVSNCRKRTISSDLILGLIFSIVIVIITTGTIYYYYFTSLSQHELSIRMDNTADEFAEVMVLPLWDLDFISVKQISEIYLNSEFVAGIQVKMGSGDIVFEELPEESSDLITITNEIVRENEILGAATLMFTTVSIKENQGRIIKAIIITIILMIIIISLGTYLIMKSLLNKPIDKLIYGIRNIAKGEYKSQLSLVPQRDVNQIIVAINIMAEQIETTTTQLKTDITQRKRAEAELLYLRNYLSNIINSMPSVLVGVNIDGKVTHWNAAAEKTTGIAATDAQGKILSDVFPQMAAEMEKIAESIRTREMKQERKKSCKPTGEICFEDVTIYPLIANGVDGAAIRIDDVTEKVRMEEILIQSEKMLSVGGLAAGMAHEINNPLAAVMQNANNMVRRLDMDANIPANVKAAESVGVSMEVIQDYMQARDIPRMIKNINESGRRVIDVMNNMLSFSQKSDSKVSACSLQKLLDKTLELATSDYDFEKNFDFKHIKIKKEYEDDLPLVPCESSKIQQVFLNVLRNGSQVLQEAGTENPQLIVRLRFEKPKQMVVIEIEDNGPGMNEENRKRVFEPFYTTKTKRSGTGLGLSLSYFIITDNHNGEMSVESIPGAGAKFIIRLPLKGRVVQSSE